MNGVVDGIDLGIVDNDSYNFEKGYIQSDLNGDNLTDAADLSIADNNTIIFVSVARPWRWKVKCETSNLKSNN